MRVNGCKMDFELQILPSMCDREYLLDMPAALDILQDYATVHADSFDIGPDGMVRRRMFWIISKIRLHVNRMPSMMQKVSAVTWIQPADRASCERDIALYEGDETLLYGKSVWAVISRDTGKLVHMDGLYPEVEFDMAPPDDRPFARISRKFEDADLLGEYTIRSGDIDTGGHMNNVHYLRAMLGCFSLEELDEMDFNEIELNFISQSFEGETLRFMKRPVEGGLEIGALNSEGKTVFAASVKHV